MENSWINFVEKSQRITGYYDPVPDLKKIEVDALIAYSHFITIKIFMPFMPNKVSSEKWVSKGYNKMVLKLDCMGIEKASLSNWFYSKGIKKFDVVIKQYDNENYEINGTECSNNGEEANFYIKAKKIFMQNLEPITLSEQSYY